MTTEDESLTQQALSDEEIKAIAHLARIEIEDEQIADLSNDMTNILHLIAKVGECQTEKTPPLAHPLEMEQRLRPDKVTESDQRDQFQTVAPLIEEGLYLVPKVIE